jgi:hypothetical protein
MQIGRIEGSTRILGKAQGYAGLPVRDEVYELIEDGERWPSMVSAWHPTPKELEDLNAGAAVHIRVLGGTHPPMQVFVGEPPR